LLAQVDDCGFRHYHNISQESYHAKIPKKRLFRPGQFFPAKGGPKLQSVVLGVVPCKTRTGPFDTVNEALLRLSIHPVGYFINAFIPAHISELMDVGLKTSLLRFYLHKSLQFRINVLSSHYHTTWYREVAATPNN
jgi:hypothetical protein